jgi:hypothetical protein
MQEAPKWLARPISTTLHAGLGFPPRVARHGREIKSPRNRLDAHRENLPAIGASPKFRAPAWRALSISGPPATARPVTPAPCCMAAACLLSAAWAHIGRGIWRMGARRGGRWWCRQRHKYCISPGQAWFSQIVGWRPQQDSNLRTRLRRPLLYPLSYGGSDTARQPLTASRSQGTSTVGM